MTTAAGQLSAIDMGTGKPPRSAATIVSITDNSGGTGTDTIAAIGATYDQAEVRNAVASLSDKLEEVLVVLQNCGLRN